MRARAGGLRVAVALAVLMLTTALAGCSALAGGTGAGAASPAATAGAQASSPAATPNPALGVELTQEQVEKVVPDPTALSTSQWQALRTARDPSTVTTGPATRVRSDCSAPSALGVAAFPAAEPTAEAEMSYTRTTTPPQAVGVQVLSYADELGARDLLRIEQAIDECPSFTMVTSDGTTVPAKLSPLDVPTTYGDGVFAVRLTFTVHGATQFEDIAHVVAGHTLINILQVGADDADRDIVPSLMADTMAHLTSVTGAGSP